MLPEQPGDVERTCADISKAKELLGYNPKVTFEEGIARTTAWYKEALEAGLISNSAENSNVQGDSLAKETTKAPKQSLTKAQSDLELSSFVEKASTQFRMRTERILSI